MNAGRALGLLLVLLAAGARADPDPWFGADKAAHFGVSGALALAGYTAATSFSDSPRVRLGYGASVALLAGIGKELWDYSGYGDPSWKDFTWDLIGAAVGLGICWAIDSFVVPIFSRPHPAPAP